MRRSYGEAVVPDVQKRLRGLSFDKQEQLVRDLCGETFTDDERGPFRFLRVCENGTVKRCWMGQCDHPVELCSLEEAVLVILSQSRDHPMVRALAEKFA